MTDPPVRFSVRARRGEDDQRARRLERFIQHAAELPLTDPVALDWFFAWLLEEARLSAFMRRLGDPT